MNNNCLAYFCYTGDHCLHYVPKPRVTVTSDDVRAEGRPLLATARFTPERGISARIQRCADVTDARHSSPLTTAHAHCASDVIGDDDDAATTTSGSYVVDARELCNEIEQMFFTGI